MRVLLDECVPRPLRKSRVGHDVRTIQELGWSGLKNGLLLKAMTTAGFEVLLTVDQNIQYEQNLSLFGIGVVLMVARSNKLKDLIPLAPGVMASLSTIQPGEHIVVTLP